MATLLPLILVNACLGSFKISIVVSPTVSNISPEAYTTGGDGINCKIDSDVTDLPEPLSPTIATISPLFTVIDILFKALVIIPLLLKLTVKFFICNKGLLIL